MRQGFAAGFPPTAAFFCYKELQDVSGGGGLAGGLADESRLAADKLAGEKGLAPLAEELIKKDNLAGGLVDKTLASDDDGRINPR